MAQKTQKLDDLPREERIRLLRTLMILMFIGAGLVPLVLMLAVFAFFGFVANIFYFVAIAIGVSDMAFALHYRAKLKAAMDEDAPSVRR
ncbi:MAG: hypothetical protein U9N14_00560 [Pseudomonadota bacterium]|nr:hypothetical protein [Pseudomonadota bacterium]